ncbi:hypothetical protein JXM67_13505 [candidate division WOR-3 bacterium]|nr:hypothetical protein [candidate division WOR-3 bacterium]
MSGTQMIKDYESSHVDASRFSGDTNFINKDTLDKALYWLDGRSFSHGVTYGDQPVDTGSPGWVGRMLGRMAERITLKIENGSKKDWKSYDGKSYAWDIKNEKDKDKLGGVSFNPSKDLKPIISISKRCTSKAVIRALIFHELIEVFTSVTYGLGYTYGTNTSSHNTAYSIVKMFNMEEQYEKAIRLVNLVKCYHELKYIAEKLIEKQKGTGVGNYGLFTNIMDVINCLKKDLIIPGYFEGYAING